MRNKNKIDMNGNLSLSRSWRRMINREKENNFSQKEIRRDLYDSLRKLDNEPLVRQWASYFLREVRVNSKNGFQNLSYKEQDKIIFKSMQEVVSVLGVEDLYFSKRVGSYNQTNYSIPLRKELTRLVYQVYLKNSRLD
ncbi:MAG: hypothetical protein AABW67_05900 [Nanoarchaeota archaeon]